MLSPAKWIFKDQGIGGELKFKMDLDKCDAVQVTTE